jgi:hypothetical protein
VLSDPGHARVDQASPRIALSRHRLGNVLSHPCRRRIRQLRIAPHTSTSLGVDYNFVAEDEFFRLHDEGAHAPKFQVTAMGLYSVGLTGGS